MKALDDKSQAENSKATDNPIRAEIRRLTRSVANIGPESQNDIKRLTEISQSHPHDFARAVSFDLAHMAYQLIAMTECPTSDKRLEDMVVRLEMMARSLAGDNPSEARRLCAQAVAFAWGEFWILNTKAAMEGVSKQTIEATQQRTAAQRRLMSAVKTLTQIVEIEDGAKRKADGSNPFGGLFGAGPTT